MRGSLDTAGVRLSVRCDVDWAARLIAEGCAGELRGEDVHAAATVHVEADRRPFDTTRWRLLTRGAWERDGELVLTDVCTTGFDLRVTHDAGRPAFTFRWRPRPRSRAAAWALRSRFHLLARAALIQFPALWWASVLGRAPLHASAVETAGGSLLVAAPSGVGRSTLLIHELKAGGRATGDNLGVSDGETVWGLVEPIRVDGGARGRRMPHGRREMPLAARAESLRPAAVPHSSPARRMRPPGRSSPAPTWRASCAGSGRSPPSWRPAPAADLLIPTSPRSQPNSRQRCRAGRCGWGGTEPGCVI
jgi:hypothetical protein